MRRDNITLDTFLELPETTPASEYINGQIIHKPMPHFAENLKITVEQLFSWLRV